MTELRVRGVRNLFMELRLKKDNSVYVKTELISLEKIQVVPNPVNKFLILERFVLYP
jgi:hypothetical protein